MVIFEQIRMHKQQRQKAIFSSGNFVLIFYLSSAYMVESLHFVCEYL